MKGTTFLGGFAICLLLLVISKIADLSSAICIVFAILLWGSIAVIVGLLIFGIISSLVTHSISPLGHCCVIAVSILGAAAILLIFLFLAAAVVDLCITFRNMFSCVPKEGISFERLLFPWR